MTTASSTPPNVCAVLVTYRPDAGVVKRAAAVAPQVDRLIVVDNGSPPAQTAALEGWLASTGATWIANGTNRGVATALNQAARVASDAGYRWLLTLDQDSTVSRDLVRDLVDAVASEPDPENIGIAAPVTEHQRDRRCDGRIAVPRRTAITSGSLVSLAGWREVGGFRDDFFIDMIDAEFALRLATRGYRVILACRATIDHRIGEPTNHRLLGRVVATSNHPAWRRYYIARNRIHVWRANLLRAPAWVLVDGWGEVRDTIFMSLAETDRRRKLRATARGLVDGLRGRTGALVRPPDSAPSGRAGVGPW